MKKITILILFLQLFLFSTKGQVKIDSAVNFIAPTPYGDTIDLYSYLDDGKYVMIEFFRTT